MTEAQFTDAVIETALLFHWSVTHFRPAWSERGWRTAVQGHKGFPDIALARNGIVLLAELKADKGKLRPEQVIWRDAIGPEHYRLWFPSDLPAIVRELS
jgi:hypothetical protein